MNIKRLIPLCVLLLTATPMFGQASLRLTVPWVFSGYRNIGLDWQLDTVLRPTNAMWRQVNDSIKRENLSLNAIEYADMLLNADTTRTSFDNPDNDFNTEEPAFSGDFDPDHPLGPEIPYWLDRAIREYDFVDNYIYTTMVRNPRYIDYAEWNLPIPPHLPEEDYSFRGFIKNLHLPVSSVPVPDMAVKSEPGHINWLHTFNISLQLSQAYISHNWYQGGSDYLAFFGNFLWDVSLNPVYHPNTMFQSTVNYKLAINSTSQDEYHKYAVSQELFQYDLKLGFKATRHWYYSLTTQFKTQFLHSYGSNSMIRTASFLSPGTLNVGLGMTYSYAKKNNKLTLTASVSPVSYNLRTCIDNLVDHAQFGMEPGQRILNELGSNAEVNFFWAFRENISYKTRLFLFTDYSNFTGDWENTLNFQWSKLFSTQLYFYLRYDTAADSSIAPKWKKWMLKEILSVGLSYTFTTKR